jgi:hypothetical protein
MVSLENIKEWLAELNTNTPIPNNFITRFRNIKQIAQIQAYIHIKENEEDIEGFFRKLPCRVPRVPIENIRLIRQMKRSFNDYNTLKNEKDIATFR